MTLTHDQRAWLPTLSVAEGSPQPLLWPRTLAASVVAQLALLTALSLLVGLGPVGWLAAAAYTAAVWFGLAHGLGDRTALGPADKVTLTRSALVGCVTALVADTVAQAAPVPLLVGMTLVALVLDGVDGQVARRTGTASDLGARFDMEVDAFLIMMLSGYVAIQLGPWVLAIGLMRYAFIVAGRMLDWLRAPVPSSMTGKVIAATQGVVLVVSTAGIVSTAIMTWAVAAALAALVFSFGRSVLWLRRNRFAVSAPAVRTH